MAELSAASAGTVTLGGLTVNRIGLGTNRIADTPSARKLLTTAVEQGVNFIDTAYRYGDGASEKTIGETLAPYDGVIVASKGGWEDTKPGELRAELETSLRRLKLDRIDVYQLHRVNPNVPIEESVDALCTLQQEGLIRYIGLSEVTVEQIERARSVTDIVSVQNHYNVMMRQYEDVVDYCERESIAFIPWFPLGGLAGDAEKVNMLLADMAKKYKATPQQIALAWLLKRSPFILPIPGTLSIEHLEENLGATHIALSEDDYLELTEL